ncbi:MAG: ArsA family ATPase [Deltaproteobacteria bacterium]|nr:ArsA family ATPase [Deltaproteobacteria bacterium]
MTTSASLRRSLQIVTGKGGVGKSAVAAAIAWRLAREGRRTLLFQVNAADAHGSMLGVDPIVEVEREIAPHLWAVNSTPAAALREYGLLTLRLRAIYNAVFENRLVKSFLRFVPSLGELNMLGKAWYHVGVGRDAPDVFDHVVVDAPSTGHGLPFLNVARVVAEGALPGPLKSQAEAMARTVQDPRLTAVHVVSLPEPMAVEESIELLQRLSSERIAPLGIGVVNRYGPHLFADDDLGRYERLRDQAAPALRPVLQAAWLRARRERQERELRDRLLASTPVVWQALPDLVEPVTRREQIGQLGDLLIEPGSKASGDEPDHRRAGA